MTQFAKDEFDLLSPPRRSRYSVRTGTFSDIPAVYNLIEQHVLGPVASPDAMKVALLRNRNTLSVFVRNDVIAGFHSALHLTREGLSNLLTGAFNPLDPDARFLAESSAVPAAIYVWLVVAPGLAFEGMLQIAGQLREPFFARADLFSRPATPDGERRLLAFGYHRLDGGLPNLHRYIRHANRPGLQQQAA